MRHLIWYTRSALCAHEWEREECKVRMTGSQSGEWERISATCKKCGWHRRYWKF